MNAQLGKSSAIIFKLDSIETKKNKITFCVKNVIYLKITTLWSIILTYFM